MSNRAPRWLSGGCNCGKVRYRVADAFDYAQNCHCSVCRKATGSAFKPFGGIRYDQFELLGNAGELLLVGGAVDHDVRCASCGAYLYSVVRDGAYVHVAFGSLDDLPTRRPDGHIFVGSKAPWYEITDDLPQFEEFPPS